MKSRRGQVTIFIILAVLIVGGIVLYFSLRDSVSSGMNEDLQPVYDYYLGCVSDAAERGIAILGAKGGYIDEPDFEAGSLFAPQSSQLDFFGQAVPYWLYVSGNGILKKQVPSRSQMAGQLEEFVAKEIGKCDFGDFEAAGYDVYFGDADVFATINENDVGVVVDQDLSLYKGEVSAVVRTSEVDVDSKLGKFYDLAVETFEYEESAMFLEDYVMDVMRLYAPVDGVDLTCSPKVVDKNGVRGEIVDALVANVGMLKLEGDYYDLPEDDRGYFVVDELESDEKVNFMYSSEWPTKIEIYGDEVVSPVGLQEGLGFLGFCYLPYHFVYDIYFPVMIQFYDGEELFQFPVVTVVSKNQAREALNVSGYSSIQSEMCSYRNQEVLVNTYDMNLNPVESRVSFECLQESCDVGETDSEGSLVGYFPQCLNGFIVAQAEGYADSKYMISTNSEDVANVVMKKKYNLSLDLGIVDKALVSFVGEDYSATVMYPYSNSIELVEDYYNVTVYAYEDSSLKFSEVTRQECVDVATGALGVLGITNEECYDITIPAMDIENAIIGGGRSVDYILDNELSRAVELNLEFPIFDTPGSLEELQSNYDLVEVSEVYLSFD